MNVYDYDTLKAYREVMLEHDIELCLDNIYDFLEELQPYMISNISEIDEKIQIYLLRMALRYWFEGTHIYKKYGVNSDKYWVRMCISAMALDEKLSDKGYGADNFKKRLQELYGYFILLYDGLGSYIFH